MPEATPQEEVVNPMGKDPNKPETAISSLNKSHLSSNELSRVEKGEVSISDLVRERNQLAQTAQAEMDQMLELKDGDDAINMIELQRMKKQIKGYEKEVEACKSPEEMRALLDEIRELPDKMKQEKNDSAKRSEMENQRLDINDEALREKVKEFTEICEKEKYLLGNRNVKGYVDWFEQELRKKPTLANAQNIIDRLEGKIPDENGLGPRRETYNELSDLFKRYKLGTPQKSEYIKQNGQSERKEFLRNAKEAEKVLGTTNDDLWTSKARTETMQEMLKAKNPADQKEKIQEIKDIEKIQSTGYSYMKNTGSVNGVSVRKMSDASIAAYLKDLKDEGGIKKRRDYITGNGKYTNGIKKAVDNEFSLYGEDELDTETAAVARVSTGLGGIYKDHPDLFKKSSTEF